MASGCFLTGVVVAFFIALFGFVPIRSTIEPLPPEPVVVTVAAEPQPACAWNWATQMLPELTDEVQAAFDEAGINGEITVTAFGEDCVNPDSTVRNFATMQTEFAITIETLSDNTIHDVLRTLAQFPVDETPGPLPGYVTIRSTDSGQQLRFNYDEGMDALNANLTGDALLDALGGLLP